MRAAVVQGQGSTAGRELRENRIRPELSTLTRLTLVLNRREAAKNPDEDNAAVECYLQCCPGDSYADRAAVDLLDQILSEPAYNQLRTKEQLG